MSTLYVHVAVDVQVDGKLIMVLQFLPTTVTVSSVLVVDTGIPAVGATFKVGSKCVFSCN